MKQRTKLAMLFTLMLVAAGVFYFDGKGIPFSGKTSTFTAKNYAPLPVENPELRRWKIDASRRTAYQSSGRDLFSASLPPAPVQRKPEPAPVAVIQPTPEPPPPESLHRLETRRVLRLSVSRSTAEAQRNAEQR